MRALLLATALLVPAFAPSAARAQPAAATAPAEDFDAYVENVRKAFDVPGIAVAIHWFPAEIGNAVIPAQAGIQLDSAFGSTLQQR